MAGQDRHPELEPRLSGQEEGLGALVTQLFGAEHSQAWFVRITCVMAILQQLYLLLLRAL
jgi:hypothetical protein